MQEGMVLSSSLSSLRHLSLIVIKSTPCRREWSSLLHSAHYIIRLSLFLNRHHAGGNSPLFFTQLIASCICLSYQQTMILKSLPKSSVGLVTDAPFLISLITHLAIVAHNLFPACYYGIPSTCES